MAKFPGGNAEDYAMRGMVLHLGYGIVAGVVFAVGVPVVGLWLGSLGVAAVLGFVYGVILMIAGTVLWMRGAIGIEADGGTMMMFGTIHVIYGLVLGPSSARATWPDRTPKSQQHTHTPYRRQQ